MIWKFTGRAAGAAERFARLASGAIDCAVTRTLASPRCSR
jgi:hypothetical protein